MESSDSEHVDQIPAWAEEQFLRDVRSGTADISTLIETIADQLPEIRDSVIAYLKLLAFVECGSAHSADQTSPLPESIGVYQVDRLIGRGGMGTVVAAHGPDDERVAIKILNPERGPFLERFRREASTIAALSHPGIVKIKGFHDDPALPSLVLEYVDGVSLDALLKPPADGSQETDTTAALLEPAADGAARRLLIAHDFTTIAHIGQAVAEALAHTHARGIIHRDIKPANIIYGVDGRVCITDFGLARPLKTRDGFTLTGDVIGTPRYMAPEQLRGVADERCDIYSLGVTMWELCTGRSAWESPVESQPHGWKLPPARAVQPDVPIELSDLIGECCEFEPKLRPAARDVAARLAGRPVPLSTADTPSAAPHPPAVHPAAAVRPADSLSSRRIRLWLLAAAAVLLAAVLATPFYPGGASSDSPQKKALTNTATARGRRATLSIPQLDVSARSGQTCFDLRELIPVGERHRGLSAKITGGKDAHRFRIDLNSQLCVTDINTCLPGGNGPLEIELLIEDCPQPTWAAVVEYGTDDICMMLSDGRDPQFFRVPDAKGLVLSRSVGLASTDGTTFLTTVPAADGSVALWSFEIGADRQLTNVWCLCKNCRLPSGVEAFATSTGSDFYVAGCADRSDFAQRTFPGAHSRYLWKFALQDDGTFRQISKRPLAIDTDQVSHLFVSGDSVLRFGWHSGTMKLRGWIDRAATDAVPTPFGDRGYETLALACWLTASSGTGQRFKLQITPQRWDEQQTLVKSRLDGTPRSLSLVNETAKELNVFWINFEGQRNYVTQIPANSPYELATYVGHTLEIHTDDAIWAAFTVCEQMPTIKIAGPSRIPHRTY